MESWVAQFNHLYVDAHLARVPCKLSGASGQAGSVSKLLQGSSSVASVAQISTQREEQISQLWLNLHLLTDK